MAFALAVASCGGSEPADSPLSEGRTVYGSTCSACHGSNGQGGVGPGFADVALTFPTCAEQIQWITLGSERWKKEVGPTYGATGKPIENVMPEMGAQLTPQEIAAVAAFERIQYGDMDKASTLTECGFEPAQTP
jgi:mono/diheme cytochrome c family protein